MADPKLKVEIDADASGASKGFDQAGDAAERMSDRVKRAGRRAQVANDNFRKASRGSGAFGRAVQNASFQVGDFATQVGAGTSASIALGQQLPQLIGGFGILGAAIGAVVAISVPLARVLGDIQKGGKDLTPILGEALPMFQALGSAMATVKEIAIDFAELVINNLDRVLITAGAVAAFFAGKWVVSFAAARIATLSLVGSLALLKKALITTGIGAVVVAAGELVYRFVQLVNGAGSFQKAMDLVAKAVGLSFQTVGAMISRFWFNLLGDITSAFAEMADSLGLDAIVASLNDATRSLAKSWADATLRVHEFGTAYTKVVNEITGLMSGANRKKLSLSDLFSGGDGADGDSPAKAAETAERERLAGKLKAITDTFRTEKEILYAQLAEKTQILNDARSAELLTEQEHLLAKEALHKQHADKLAAIEAAQKNQSLSRASSTFGSLQSMAQSFGKKGAKIAQGFGIAKALISTFTGAAKALELPFPANMAAFAQVMATGLGAVASIKSVNTNGGGGAAAGGAGRGAAAPAQKPLDVFVQGIGANDLITGGQLSSLFDKLVDEAGDRGIRPVFAA